MRKGVKWWIPRVVAALLACLALYVAGYFLLPRTADGISVTVVHYASYLDYDASPSKESGGTLIFQRSFTDAATVSGVRAALNRLQYYSFSDNAGCDAGPQKPNVYILHLLWHGVPVKSYELKDAGCYWDATTLGVKIPQTVLGDPSIWQDLLRLTGMPDHDYDYTASPQAQAMRPTV